MEDPSKNHIRASHFSLALISELINIIHQECGKIIDENEAQDIGTKIAKFVLAKEYENHVQAV